MHFDPDPQNYDGSRPYWLKNRPSAISVETSAYALLAQMERGDYDYAGRIAIWLSDQQNYDGGFVSTQVSAPPPPFPLGESSLRRLYHISENRSQKSTLNEVNQKTPLKLIIG